MRCSRFLVGGLIALLAATGIGRGAAVYQQLGDRAFVTVPDDPAIEYSTRPLRDPVSELNRRIERGEMPLTFEKEHGYLPSVLSALNVPVESQLLVFSKTSFQSRRIDPAHPRAIFFNDSVSVGWVPGGDVLELAAQDPRQGVAFYTLDQTAADKPAFARRNICVSCHESRANLDVPGMTVRSVFPSQNGTALPQLGGSSTDHRTPIDQRWGGWYVTGTHGSMRHMGNAVVADRADPESMISDRTLNVESLDGRFDVHTYLSPHSDLVALMVFEHQMHLMNLLTRLGWEVRVAAYRGEPKATLLADSARELVDYLLFVDEAPLRDSIRGTSGFAQAFGAAGSRDRNGRSLRQLDLERRLFRYPCSYMIYTGAFDELPADALDAVYKRLWRILSGEEKGVRYARLSLADRRAIVDILRDTKKGLPEYFRPVTQ